MNLAEHDPEPAGPRRPRAWLVALVVIVVAAVIALHLTGVIGQG